MKSKVATFATLALLITGVPALAQSWGRPSAGVDRFRAMQNAEARRDRPRVTPVEAFLAKPIEHTKWEDNSLEEVLDWMRDESRSVGRINLIPRWNALAAEGIDRDRFITLELYDTTMGELLTEVLAQLSETGEATLHGEGNRLVISTKSDFGRKLEMRVYDVKDVLFRLPDFSESAPQIDLQRRSGGQAGGGGQPVFSNSGGQNTEELREEGDDQDPEQILEDLVTLIEDTVDPLTWDASGGPGRIRGFNKHVIVVYNTIEVHEKIAGFFARHR